jgi:hypothetical protein
VESCYNTPELELRALHVAVTLGCARYRTCCVPRDATELFPSLLQCTTVHRLRSNAPDTVFGGWRTVCYLLYTCSGLYVDLDTNLFSTGQFCNNANPCLRLQTGQSGVILNHRLHRLFMHTMPGQHALLKGPPLNPPYGVHNCTRLASLQSVELCWAFSAK